MILAVSTTFSYPSAYGSRHDPQLDPRRAEPHTWTRALSLRERNRRRGRAAPVAARPRGRGRGGGAGGGPRRAPHDARREGGGPGTQGHARGRRGRPPGRGLGGRL